MDYKTGFEGRGLFEMVPVSGPASAPIDREHVDDVMVDVVHDGCVIPQELLVDDAGQPFAQRLFVDSYVRERDWGASVMAKELATAMGLPGFYRVNLARVVMDFGRFPGSTPRSAPHLHRFAINYPFSELLSFRQKRALLERYYDKISDAMDAAVGPRRLKLAMHTYDPYNANGTLRAPVSLITRVEGLHQDHVSEAFDPLYPAQLGEWTADRILRNRISLTVEKAGFGVAHNFPYTLPEGSIEVRSQVWRFFSFLHQSFDVVFPQTVDEPAYQAVWAMLQDTNRRDASSQVLRAYLHNFQRPPAGQAAVFEAAQVAYERVTEFLDRDDRALVRQYRYASWRPSAFAIEVRKDMVYNYDKRGFPDGPPLDTARHLAHAISQAIRTYLREDRPMSMGHRV